MRIKFRFLADDSAPDITSGTATWQIITNEGVFLMTKMQRFATYDEAHEMNNLVNAVYSGGCGDGKQNVCRAVELVTKEFG